MKKKISVIGLGYVGLPLAVAFAEKFEVIGFDINHVRIKELEKSHDRTLEIESHLLVSVRENLSYSSDPEDIKDCNIYIITVPTPIDESNQPVLTPLIEASKTVGNLLNENDIVIYESTVYPGVTENICAPELERSSGMKFNKDFFCGYSPERINPGDKERSIKKILKVTSGSTPKIAQHVDELYKQIISAGTFQASSIKVAEASKLIENTQRYVNIALINELAIIFDRMDIDTNEVIKAASTKWNFFKFVPGLVGGHCIGVDPYYLTYLTDQLGYHSDLISSSHQINSGMSTYIVNQTIKQMSKAGKAIKNSNILILGLTFKENCPDIRNTKVIDIIEELEVFGANIDVYDPWVDPKEVKILNMPNIIGNPLKNNKKYDAILVSVGHSQFKLYESTEYQRLSNGDKVVIDIKNIVENPTWRL